MNTRKRDHHYLLLQINDALFPIGGYSHSYGLETYIQKGLVDQEEDTWHFLENRLRYSFCYNELLSAKLAYDYASKGELDKLLFLGEWIEASRIPKEVREAGHKLGSRMVKTLQSMSLVLEEDIFWLYVERAGKEMTHSVLYGVLCYAAGIHREDALANYLYAQCSATVTNCVKTIPLSQSLGQKLLYRSYGLFHEIMEKVETLTERELCQSAPGFDIRCMQHEGLYSRIYMS